MNQANSMVQVNLVKKYPPVLSVKQVAEILCVSHNTAYLGPCGFYPRDDSDL